MKTACGGRKDSAWGEVDMPFEVVGAGDRKIGWVRSF
jgi:hypothetical protein